MIKDFSKALLCLTFILSSCSEKSVELSTEMAGNRVMGFTLRNVKTSDTSTVDPADRDYFVNLIRQSLGDAYGAQIQFLELDQDDVLESPNNLYAIAINKIDDLFVMDLEIPSDLSGLDAAAPIEGEPAPSYGLVELSGEVRNGGNLRTVNTFNFSLALQDRANFEKAFVEKTKSSIRDVFSNPNIYPTSDPLHFANLLYVYSEKRVEDLKDPLTCQNAPTAYEYYSKANELFLMADEKGLDKLVGQQGEAHQMATRRDESAEKAKTAGLCVEDEKLQFAVNFEFNTLNPDYKPFIIEAFRRAKLENLLRRYTDKPVLIEINVQGNGSLTLVLKMRFHPKKYLAWTTNRVPPIMKGFHVISLDPYYALMQTLVAFRLLLPKNSPKALIQNFTATQMNLMLDTILRGSVTIAVDGTYVQEQKIVKLAYPNSLVLDSPGYSSITLANREESVFQEKGWLTFGSCSTIDGSRTEDGLILDFFNLSCKL